MTTDSPDTLPKPIRRLPIATVNRIAAGEVIERPAAVVKELVENALDAGATAIDIRIEKGGLGLIQIKDNGHGIPPDSLPIALERHATSKLTAPETGPVDLLNIDTMGFRGEALPSIASIARFTILSRAIGHDDAFEIRVEAGETNALAPAAWTGREPHGTQISVADLFYATPARLKFLSSERAESMAISDTLKRLAMAQPQVSFTLTSEGRQSLNLPAETGENGPLRRIAAILGKEFQPNAIALDQTREGYTVRGFAGLPTLSRGNAQKQFLFVNNRPVKDRLLTGVVRAAYQDFLARDRHPMVAIFLQCPTEMVDVNVHPAKTEVRFRDPAMVRGLILGALRHGLAAAGHRASTQVAAQALGAAKPEGVSTLTTPLYQSPYGAGLQGNYASTSGRSYAPNTYSSNSYAAESGVNPPRDDGVLAPAARAWDATDTPQLPQGNFPLGAARAQLHETYVVSQTEDGIVIVDQHAAHERLVYEKMKAQMSAGGIRRQALLIPEIVSLDEAACERILARQKELDAFGLEIEPFGINTVCVRATPALFGNIDMAGLIQDIADDLASYDEGLALREKFEDIMGNMACRSSIRAGRRLTAEEMNALLREMEVTPYSGQCNHGRPTYVELKLADIERLFGRR